MSKLVSTRSIFPYFQPNKPAAPAPKPNAPNQIASVVGDAAGHPAHWKKNGEPPSHPKTHEAQPRVAAAAKAGVEPAASDDRKCAAVGAAAAESSVAAGPAVNDGKPSYAKIASVAKRPSTPTKLHHDAYPRYISGYMSRYIYL